MSTVPMRISREAASTIDELAARLGCAKQQVVDQAVRRYETELRMREAGQAMQRLRGDRRRWKAYQKETDAIVAMAAQPEAKS